MTAQRLPIPGSDDGGWGDILNGFLEVEHQSDGMLKIRTDGTVAPLNQSAQVPIANLPTGTSASSVAVGNDNRFAGSTAGTTGAALSATDPSVSNGRTPAGVASGDLSGTYPSPTVAQINGTNLAALASGLLKNTTGTGVPSIATAADIPDLSATYAKLASPALTGTPTINGQSIATTNGFSTSLSNVTETNLLKVRQATSKARAGSAGIIWTIGASLTRGYYGTGSYFSPGQFGPAAFLRSRLASAGVTVDGTGFVSVLANLNDLSASDSRYSVSGSVTASGDNPFVIMGSNASLTFVSDVAGTEVDVIVANNGTAGLTIRVDGGTTFTPTLTGASSWQLYKITGLSNALHTVVITAPSSATEYISAVRVWSGGIGLDISDIAIGGEGSGDWATTSVYDQGGIWTPTVTGETPDVVILGCDLYINDVETYGLSVSQATANMVTIIENFQSLGTQVVLYLIVEPDPSKWVSQATFASIISAAQNLATTYSLPLLNEPARLIDFTTSNELGYVQPDGGHRTKSGYAEMGDLWYSLFTANI